MSEDQSTKRSHEGDVRGVKAMEPVEQIPHYQKTDSEARRPALEERKDFAHAHTLAILRTRHGVA